MISPVSMSNVRFYGQPEAENNILSRPGAFTKPEAAPAKPKKKKHTGRNILLTALVLAAALVTLNKTNVLKVLPKEELADAKLLKKAGHYLSKAGEFVGKYTVDLVAKLFKKKPAA